MANSVDPDQIPPFAASDPGQHCPSLSVRIIVVNMVFLHDTKAMYSLEASHRHKMQFFMEK